MKQKPIQLNDFSVNDLKIIAQFKRVIKNYLRMKEIEVVSKMEISEKEHGIK